MGIGARRMAVAAGWASVGLGAVQAALPARVGAATGLALSPSALRAGGVADLIVGVGLLRGGQPARWLAARALLNLGYCGFCLRALRGDGPSRGRTVALLTLLATLTPFDVRAAWQSRPPSAARP